MFNKILLAVDGSLDAREASRLTLDLALRDKALVIIVHAFDPVPGYLGEPYSSKASSEHVTEGQKIAHEAARDFESTGLEIQVVVLEGPAAKAILNVAETRQPDLIIMGSRGHGKLTSLLMGSVSHRVVAEAKVPVLIVKAQKE